MNAEAHLQPARQHRPEAAHQHSRQARQKQQEHGGRNGHEQDHQRAGQSAQIDLPLHADIEQLAAEADQRRKTREDQRRGLGQHLGQTADGGEGINDEIIVHPQGIFMLEQDEYAADDHGDEDIEQHDTQIPQHGFFAVKHPRRLLSSECPSSGCRCGLCPLRRAPPCP